MSTNVTDQRGALPSASRMTRTLNCPASFKMNLSELPEGSEAADEGTMLHRVCELMMLVNCDMSTQADEVILSSMQGRLTGEQSIVVKTAWEIVDAERAAMNMAGDVNVLVEQRLWSKSRLFSGKADVVLTHVNYALIIDYKFGRGDVEAADSNMQLAALAVLARDNFGVDLVDVMIIQPRALEFSKRITKCRYRLDEMQDAAERIDAACLATELEEPPQQCGYWCTYCPSAYRCKAAQNMIEAQAAVAIAPAGMAIGVHNAKDIYERAKLVKKFCDVLLDKIKDWLVANPDADCGLSLTAGSRRANLGDGNSIFAAVEGVGISDEEFAAVCKVEKGKLEDIYYAKRLLKNEKLTRKLSDEELDELLVTAGLLTYTQTAPSLKSKGEK